MDVIQTNEGFEIVSPGGVCLIRHTQRDPAFALGTGGVEFAMQRGNFTISKADNSPIPLVLSSVDQIGGAEWRISLNDERTSGLALIVRLNERSLQFENCSPEAKQFQIKLVAEPDEAAWGCGMQYSYLNLRGRTFPIWASEPGVGRDKSSKLTQRMDLEGGAGGDYWTTGYPQPTFLSSRGYAVHVNSSAYAEFDFTDQTSHSVTFWDVPQSIELYFGENSAGIVSQLSARFGPQSPLPEWTLGGATIGLKQGAASFDRLERMIDAGASVTGIWCEDWVGLRETSFGRRLFWDWRIDDARYPDLKERIQGLATRGIRFLGYVNPYMCTDGSLYHEAKAEDFFVRRIDNGDIYIVDFGEFECGIIDLTNPDARGWFARRVIGEEMIALGMSGWMADFGEYLPTDAKLFDGSDAAQAHNRWPVLWAQVNAEAIKRAGVEHEAIFFMRAGSSGLPRHAPLIWAGDQSVDFSRHDGIGTALTAALSAGLVGNGHSHSDIGGYTSLHGNVRSKELMMRWAEMATFTPYMRTHEGNRPDDNLQVDGDELVLDHFAAMTRLHSTLVPYSKWVSRCVAEQGLPMQRAMFLQCDDLEANSIQNQYFYGPDLLIAPMLEESARKREVFIPSESKWIDLWTGEYEEPGWHECEGQFGLPPVFYKKGSEWAELFRQACKTHLAWQTDWVGSYQLEKIARASSTDSTSR